MTGSRSFVGAFALGLAAGTVPIQAASPGPFEFPGKLNFTDVPKFPDVPPPPSGKVAIGSSKTDKKVVIASAVCSSEVMAQGWAKASSAYVNLLNDAIVTGCNGDIKTMTKSIEDAAEAYAEIAINATAKCTVHGKGASGCAFAAGSAMTHAEAVYAIWTAAKAKASNGPCGCAVKAFDAAYASVEYWEHMFATAMGTLEIQVCQSGDGTTSGTASIDCYAKAVAQLTANATAGAWLKTEVNGEKIEGHCTAADMTSCEPGQNDSCKEDAYAKAKVLAKTVVDVDESIATGCTFKYSDYLAAQGGKVTVKADGSGLTSEEKDFNAKVKCIAEAQVKTNASAAYQFVDTILSATITKCKSGVESYSAIDEGVGEAFASAWIDTKAKCEVKNNGTDAAKGCAYVEAFAESFAKGVADSWALVDSSGMFKDCKCKVEGSAVSEAQAGFTAELIADVILTAGGDLWGPDGENCVTDGTVAVETELDCLASAMAAFWNKAHVEARLEGECLLKDKAVCVHAKGPEEEQCFKDNQLYVSSFASALVETEIEFNKGYCTGKNQGGFYYFDGEGSYTCVKGC